MDRLRRGMSSLGTLAMLALATLGVSWCLSMGAPHSMAAATFCPMGEHASACDMSGLQHLGSWQAQTAATQTGTVVLLALVLVVAAALGASTVRFVPDDTPQRTYRRQRFRAAFADYLRRALASGILQPKIFSPIAA